MRVALGSILALILGASAHAQEPGTAKPNLVLQQIVEGLPKDDRQAVRVLTATFKPGDRTLFHTHRFPVTVYIIEGEFTLELADRKEPVVIKAGESFVEPVGVKMTGYNRSTTSPLRLVIFYVSDKGTPFLDPENDSSHAKP